VRCAQKKTRRGGAGKGSGSKGSRGAEYGQACTKERTGAVAVRASEEEGQHLNRPCKSCEASRGLEGNRQARNGQPYEM
jgi:hypothetical protein